MLRLTVMLALAGALTLVPSAAAQARSETPHAHAAATTNIYADYSKVGYARSSSTRWDVYESYSKVGYLRRSGTRWNIYEGYSKVGYTRRSGSKWTCYADYSNIGYVRRSYGSQWNIYAEYSKVGYARGLNAGPIGCAALVLGMV